MNEVRALLQRMAGAVEPSPDALARVLTAVRRRRRRRVAAMVTSVALIAGGLAGAAAIRHSPPQRIQVIDQLKGSRPAQELRTKLGIQGQTKGAPPVVIVRTKSKTGEVSVSAVQVQTGKSTSLPQAASAEDATVSPKGDVVAAVKNDQLVVASTRGAAGANPVVLPDATGTTGSVSWARNGSALFAPVGGRWVRVSDPAGTGGPQMIELQVPTIPGGPILLSVSPVGDQVLLFGITQSREGPAKPHLYLGQFDGRAVSQVRPIDVPDSALSGPLGWVGDNAFLLSAGPGEALIVRTDGGQDISIRAEPMDDPCARAPAGSTCTSDGPGLLGTNGDGSLLFWQVTGTVSSTSGSVGSSPTGPLMLVLYFKTWLDGTHVVRLTGDVGRYGPPLAAR